MGHCLVTGVMSLNQYMNQSVSQSAGGSDAAVLTDKLQRTLNAAARAALGSLIAVSVRYCTTNCIGSTST